MSRLAVVVLAAALVGQAPAARTLDIYYIDTEGGQATLFVSVSTGAAPAPAPAPQPTPYPNGPQGTAGHTPAYWIKVSARADGSFTVTNSRNGFSKTYDAR